MFIAVLRFSLSTHVYPRNSSNVYAEKAPSLGRCFDSHFINCHYFCIGIHIFVHCLYYKCLEITSRYEFAEIGTDLAQNFPICVWTSLFAGESSYTRNCLLFHFGPWKFSYSSIFEHRYCSLMSF